MRGGAKRVSCGVLVTDGESLLLGHAARSPRWDIPKGVADVGESHVAAAVRELREETGLEVMPGVLSDLGMQRYLPGKDLALFAWRVARMPDPGVLSCASLVQLPGGRTMPELDRFGVFAWAQAVTLVGKNLARVLADVATALHQQEPSECLSARRPCSAGP